MQFPFKRWQHWETNKSWQPFQEKNKRNILGTASHETLPFLDLTRNISQKLLKGLKAKSLKNCPRSLAGQSRAFALSKLDELLLNQQIRTHSGTVPGSFRNTKMENEEPNEDRSHDDAHSEVGPSVYQSRHSNDSEPDEDLHSWSTKNFEKKFTHIFQLSDWEKVLRNIENQTLFWKKWWNLVSDWVWGSKWTFLASSVNSFPKVTLFHFPRKDLTCLKRNQISVHRSKTIVQARNILVGNFSEKTLELSSKRSETALSQL